MNRFHPIRICLVLSMCLLCAPAPGAEVRINEFMAINNTTLTNSLGTTDWIELYNYGSSNINLTGWYLTDNAGNLTKWQFPATNIGAGAFLLVYASGTNAVIGSEIHADFGLSGSGEYLALVETDGSTVVSEYDNYEFAPGEWGYPPQEADISYGVGPTNDLRYFYPTPAQTNNSGMIGLVEDTRFEPDRGFYTNSIQVAITSETANAGIYYTTDGSSPSTNNGILYTNAISITNTTCLRAKAYKAGYYPTDVDTHTYIFIADVLTQSPTGQAPGAGWPTGAVNGQLIDYGMDPDVITNSLYSNLVDDALLAIPTVSFVTYVSNLFSAATGIYVNANFSGSAWERAVSVELINPDGSDGFQINAGMRIRGGYSVNDSNPKHAFRLFFRSEYGDAKLHFPLFGDEGVDEFDCVDVATAQNYSWSFGGDNRNTFLRDVFARDAMREMGEPYTRSRYYHLYVNGHYWGLFLTEERPEAAYAESYFGGDKDDYDVIKTMGSGLYEIEVTDGNSAAYNELWGQAVAGFASDAAYYRAQGLNPDRTRNPDYKVLLDANNVADYMIGIYFGGDRDAPISDFLSNNRVNNYFTSRNRNGDRGFVFFRHDGEHTLDTGLANRTGPFSCGTEFRYFNPQWLHQQLTSNVEYRLRFADRVHKHLFNDGALTYSSATNLILTRKAQIDTAIVAESARWGDSKQAVPRTRNAHWLPAVSNIIYTYLPGRANTVLTQFRNNGWYPLVAAPVFNQHGGLFTNGFALAMTATNPVHYTLDGTDPRECGTGIAMGTLYTAPVLLDRAVQVKARAMTDTNQWSALNEAVFVPETPSPLRITEIMYHPRNPQGAETNNGYSASDFEFIELQNTSTQTIGLAGIRFSDGVNFDFTEGDVVTLGSGEFVVVARNNEAFAARYANWRGMNIAGEFQFPVTALSDSGETVTLQDGLGRTIASVSYSDGRGWPFSADGAGHSLVPLVLDQQTNAAVNCGGNWRASAFIDGSPGDPDPTPITDVALNEIMAHTDTNSPPYDSNDGIELFNTTGSGVSLTDWYLSDDAGDLRKWQIPATNVIGANAWLHFDEMTGFHNPITNGFGLDKAGEQVFLSHLPGSGQDRVADCVRFKGQENGASLGRYADGGSYWYILAPTPGYANAFPTQDLVISEIMYHPSPTAQNPEDNTNDEFLEICNPTAWPVDMWNTAGTWRIDGADFSFPSNTTIAAGGCILLVSFDPVTNPAALAIFTNRYGLTNGETILGPYEGELSNTGERIALERPQAPDPPDTLTSWVIVDEVIYSSQSPWPEGTDAGGYSLERVNPGAAAGVFNWRKSLTTNGSPGRVSSAPAEPFIAVSPQSFDVSAYENVNAPAQSFGVWNLGAGSMNYTATSGTNWMNVSPSNGVCSGAVEVAHGVAFDTTGLPVNVYVSDITLASTNAGNSPLTVNVTLRVIERDKQPPVLESASAMGDPNEVVCVFDEPVEAGAASGGAENPTNYAVNFGINVVGASLNADGTVVTLTTSTMSTDTIYTVTVSNVRDRAVIPNTIATNSQTQFEYIYTSPVADAGDDEIVGTGTVVILNGNGSSDPDGGPQPMSYLWEQVFGPESAAIAGSNQVMASATLNLQGTYIFRLTVSDGAGSNSDDVVFLTTQPITLIAPGSAWKYLDTGTNLGSAWYAPGYDDNGWSNGPAKLGYGDAGMATIVSYGTNAANKYITTYFRAGFTVSNLSQVTSVTLGVLRDDGAVVYLNGAEMARFNMPTGVVGYQTLAASAVGGTDETTFFGYQLDPTVLLQGLNVAAVEIHQSGPASSDLSFNLYLIANRLNTDSDGDGMSDAWEVQYFGGLGQSGDTDWDYDGLNNREEYLAGTDPTDNQSYFVVQITASESNILVQHYGMSVTGLFYSPRNRFYDLTSKTNLTNPVWLPVADHTNVMGDNQPIVYTNLPGDPVMFYRVRARLE